MTGRYARIMSTPPDQPSASPYPGPPDPSAGPPAVPGGYGTPVPPQHNPYAQESPYGPQGYYAAGPPPGAVPPGAVPPGAAQPGIVAPGALPPAAGGRSGGGAGRAVLWAVVGAVVASAAWGGVLLLRKSGHDTADLRGYTVKNDLCAVTDLSAFKTRYPQPDDSPSKYSSKGESLDQMWCNEGLKMTGSSYSDSYLSVEVSLHKKSDPAAEFADAWLGYKQHKPAYDVTAVSGFGDEAYLVTQDTVDSSGSGDRYVTLAVRDGWMTYSMEWSVYATSYDSSSGKKPPDRKSVV